jgi:hypothetical protein
MMGGRSGRTLSKGGEVCTCTTTTSVVRTRYYVWYSGVRMYVHVCDVCMTCSTRVVHGTGGTVRVHTWYRVHKHTWCTIIQLF